MGWLGNKTERFRQMPNLYFSMHITAKFLGGAGLGVLLAIWLANMDWLDIHRCRFAYSHTKC